jgi:hypothetical protein
MLQDKTNCWQGAIDTMGFRDPAIGNRNIEVHTDENRFPGQFQVDKFSNHKIPADYFMDKICRS